MGVGHQSLSAGVTVQCIDCARFDMKGADQKMARLGFGLCKLRPRAEFYGATRERDCAEFQAAPEARAAERRRWLAAADARHNPAA